MYEPSVGNTGDNPNDLKEALERKREEDHLHREGMINRYGSVSAAEQKLAEEARTRERRG